MEDHYEFLGLSHDSDARAIKLQCQQLILKHHPDKSQGNNPESDDIFLQVTKAKDILLDPKKRKHYDRALKEDRLKKFHRPIYSRENLNDLEFVEEDNAYLMECRCGGTYFITDDCLSGKDIVFVPCDNCTYYLEVVAPAEKKLNNRKIAV